MRALVWLALLLALAGFDHIVHERNLDVKGVEPLPCVRCHTENKGKLVGKPGHAACFGQCHGPPPKAPRRGAKLVLGDNTKVCTSCHRAALLDKPYAGKLPAKYPPYDEEQDFNIAFGHRQHAEAECTLCHDMRPKPTRYAPHQRCLGCHDGSGARGRGPAMASCSGCHPRAVGKPQPPVLAPLRDTVSTAFSHAKHAARGAAGKDCITCHAAIRKVDDIELPRPAKPQCATSGCHDGQAAFATTAACTKCHDRAPERFEVHRPTARFSHEGVHANVVASRTCNACHPLSANGEALLGGHAVCAECHQQDFGARRPRICGACHSATEPWRHLVTDRAPPERTEFGAMLEHDKHAMACTTCHKLRTPSSQLRTPRGHASCIGKGCHENKSGPQPQFETCDGCHRIGLAAERAREREAAPWSVRRKFDHRRHEKTPDHEDLACTACHVSVSGKLLDIATPPKATCLPCHDDGKAAFKLTGTTCTRCHESGTR